MNVMAGKQPMRRLLYISTARKAPGSDELADILAVSRRNNQAVEVTGLLIVGGRRFLQALEGPDAAVEATYRRICADPRHFAVVELVRGPIAERAFPQWAMGHQRGNAGADTPTVDAAVAELIAPLQDPNLRGYFTGFAQSRAAAAA